ncbi:PIR protein CIR protein [Plasmodium vinckei vinckei]|uniref:PIR protein CIR protein n=1 Tax=Plasmodium vinckei vinckei TaxID=54757 RepID=A0A449BNT8_PLAVN|nr:PIR protein CIR protein [Plasmodium vinckei vinckei]VEV55117.1 PIR protein CIR protein [Plasmodium vinckei vinckei]
MEQSNSNIMDLYKDIYTINDYFYEDNGQLIVNTKHKSIDDNCHSWCDSGEGDCHDYLEMTNCSVFYLLNNLKDKFDSKFDKLVEYAILWLSYKLNQNSEYSGMKLNDFYTKYIETNDNYNIEIKDNDKTTYKDIINKNKYLMDNNEISKFNRLFNILFHMYYIYRVEDWNYDKNLGYAKSFAEEFEGLNEDSKNREGSLYTQILSTLSNDYDNLKNKYGENISCNFPSISKVNLPKSSVENYGKDDEQILGQSSYSIEDVYTVFNKIDRDFGVKTESGKLVEHTNQSINRYCPYISSTGSNLCFDYLQSASSGVINLLEELKKYNLEYDKLAEYAILLLSYKLNQHPQYSGTKLNDFYTNHIENNNYYNKNIKDNGPTYKEIINKNNDLMNTNEISKFNVPFSILLLLYNGIKSNNLNCKKYSSYPKTFASNFEELNNDYNINGNASFRKLLSILSHDYNNLKNKYGKDESCDFPTLSPVKTLSSSSIASKLIPGLSTFSVIPAFLGIAYKVNNKELKL